MTALILRQYGLRACGLCGLLLIAGVASAATLQVTVTDAAGNPLRYAAVMAGWAGAQPPPVGVAPATMSQRNLHFVPHMLIVPVHERISFPNMDDTRHHVYSFSPAKTFDIKLYVGRPERPITFDTPGVVSIGCNIHDQMQAYIVVSDDPVWAVTDAAGHALLRDLPDGAVTLSVWHPWMTTETARVKRQADTARSDFRISLAVSPPPTLEPSGTPSLQDRFNQLSQ